MLREITNGALVRGPLTPLGRRWGYEQPGMSPAPTWSTRRLRAILAAQAARPVAIARDGRRRTWMFEQRFYAEDDDLSADDVLALVRERERRVRRRLQRAHAMLAQDGDRAVPRRERASAEIRRAVFERDGGRCVQCGSRFEIQFDHVIPMRLGGATTAENLQVLCADCNRRKGASLQ